MNDLRALTGSVPIGAKSQLEGSRRTGHVVDAGCDFVTIDGAQGGRRSESINNVGVPRSAIRANRSWRGRQSNISLIACGG